MKLTWCGHSCFLLDTEQGRVVFDPYEPGYVPGLKLPELEAELCLCSHGHGDHNYTAGVKLSGKEHGLKVQEFSCFHDEKQGRLRGNNTMYLVEAEGRRVLHMGDLGHMPSQELVEQLGHIDLMMIPVGGYYTIDAAQAAAIVRQLKPGMVIPMHYKGRGFGFDVLSTLEDFTDRMDRVKVLDTNVFEPEWSSCPLTVVLECPVEAGVSR